MLEKVPGTANQVVSTLPSASSPKANYKKKSTEVKWESENKVS